LSIGITGYWSYGRALDELNIDIRYANSPQCKGRVERMNQALQDRLVKAPCHQRAFGIKLPDQPFQRIVGKPALLALLQCFPRPASRALRAIEAPRTLRKR